MSWGHKRAHINVEQCCKLRCVTFFFRSYLMGHVEMVINTRFTSTADYRFMKFWCNNGLTQRPPICNNERLFTLFIIDQLQVGSQHSTACLKNKPKSEFSLSVYSASQNKVPPTSKNIKNTSHNFRIIFNS